MTQRIRQHVVLGAEEHRGRARQHRSSRLSPSSGTIGDGPGPGTEPCERMLHIQPRRRQEASGPSRRASMPDQEPLATPPNPGERQPPSGYRHGPRREPLRQLREPMSRPHQARQETIRRQAAAPQGGPSPARGSRRPCPARKQARKSASRTAALRQAGSARAARVQFQQPRRELLSNCRRGDAGATVGHAYRPQLIRAPRTLEPSAAGQPSLPAGSTTAPTISAGSALRPDPRVIGRASLG